MKTITTIAIALSIALSAAACTMQGDDGGTTAPDAGSGSGGGGDLFPTGTYKSWVCYPSREGGKFLWNCNPGNNKQLATAEYVGVCKPLNLKGYWTGTHYTTVQTDGRYSAEFDNTLPVGTVCEMTFGSCSNTSDPACWAQYHDTAVGYTLCGQRPSNGGDGWGCGQFFQITGPDTLPTPISTYPVNPPVW